MKADSPPSEGGQARLVSPISLFTAPAPLALVVMGVSGSGKTSFSKAISHALNLTMLDGDDLHAPQSIAKMQAGIALADEDRWPWLDRVASFLRGNDPLGDDPVGDDGANVSNQGASPGLAAGRVIACSALKLAYRDRIRQSVPSVTFIFLDGDFDLIRSRMALRTGHFMHLELLENQLHTLERPSTSETDVITVQTALPMQKLIDHVVNALRNKQKAQSEPALQLLY